MYLTRFMQSSLCTSLLLLVVGCGPEGLPRSEEARLGPVEQGAHAWGNYHWARPANPFALKLGDNVTSAWDAYLQGAFSDWSGNDPMKTRESDHGDRGARSDRKRPPLEPARGREKPVCTWCVERSVERS